jgi:3',5'-cyclic-AMP phosphodiesterase
MRRKFIWLTDLHMRPWKRHRLVSHLNKEQPDGIFITGDISDGITLIGDLTYFATHLPCPIYFILGNHDYWMSSIDKRHNAVRELCSKHSNLIWMTEADIVRISDEVALIGDEGWYDADNGKPEYLKFTFDWWMVEDFRQLPSMTECIAAWKKLAEQSVISLSQKLERAIEQDYKNIYVLTHVPPWKEATRDVGTFMEPFWLPYNTNLVLGRALEKVMASHKKKNVVVLAGHTHSQASILVRKNLQCIVNDAHYFGYAKNQHILYI